MAADEGQHQRVTQVSGSQTAQQHRRTRRASVHGVLVAIDAPDLSSEPWVVDAIDLSASGLGLVLPPELLEDTRVLLSFQLGAHDFSRLPAVVRHRFGVAGGVRFEPWPDADRLKLLEYLVQLYESFD